ncbi:MAG: hypothetical protein MZV64_17360 [Ignavibacteriales bacterium]|nr:hypothetical protein [Ignavibacteriales bacterium]
MPTWAADRTSSPSLNSPMTSPPSPTRATSPSPSRADWATAVNCTSRKATGAKPG